MASPASAARVARRARQNVNQDSRSDSAKQQQMLQGLKSDLHIRAIQYKQTEKNVTLNTGQKIVSPVGQTR